MSAVLTVDEQIWWYVARSGGIVALFLAGGSVVWGLLLSSRILQGSPSASWLLSLHRFLGALTCIFTGVHIVGLVADSYVTFSWADILVPFASAWKPGAVALGVVSMYLLAAVQFTSMAMKRIPRRLWKWVHLSSYGLFWSGLLHGTLAGTDAGHPVYVVASAFMALLVVFLTSYRILIGRSNAGSRQGSRPRPHLRPSPTSP